MADEIEAEFRVVGEPRWAPFKRWLYPRLAKLAVLVFWFCVLVAIRVVTAPIYDHMMGH